MCGWPRQPVHSAETQPRAILAAITTWLPVVPTSRHSVWMAASDCFVCAKHEQGDSAPGGVLFQDELVYSGHAFPRKGDSAYRGYMVVEPMRHAPGLADLTEEEAGAVGRLVNRVARALKEIAGAEHVYSFVFGDGVPHLHVALAPRYPGTPGEYWGVRLTEWPDRPRLDEAEIRVFLAELQPRVIHG